MGFFPDSMVDALAGRLPEHLIGGASVEHTDGVMSKAEFAHWLLTRIARHAESRETSARLTDAQLATAA